MEPYKLYRTEIPVKGIGYLVLNQREALSRGVEELLAAGATRILARGPIAEGEWDGFRLTYCHDMFRMGRSLSDVPPLSGRLRLEPLTTAAAPVYIQLFNESFFHVPNGATIDRGELPRLMGETQRAGLAYLGREPVGVYELDLAPEPPEIEAIGLTKGMRGKGLGRELLHCAMAELAGLGHTRCTLLVSTANEAAFALYRAEGFVALEKYATWYEVTRRV